MSGRSGAGLDPCAALQTIIELEPDEEREIIFLIGEGGSDEEVQDIISRFRMLPKAKESLAEAIAYWDELLGTIEVRTPDAGVEYDHEPLAFVSVACLPYLGSLGFLSIGRGVRFS